MSYKATKPGLALSVVYLSMLYTVLLFIRDPFYVLLVFVAMCSVFFPARRRPQSLVVIGVCLSVCMSVRTVFVRKISQERVHGSPPHLVGGSRG